jgi:hypothetical protein
MVYDTLAPLTGSNEGAETGRQDQLRTGCRKTWEFDSPPS